MTHWDHTTEVLVVGTGGGAMTAALVAKQAGLDVLMIEKTEYYGGSTAISGGGLWVPNNFPFQHAGRVDVGALGATDGQPACGGLPGATHLLPLAGVAA